MLCSSSNVTKSLSNSSDASFLSGRTRKRARALISICGMLVSSITLGQAIELSLPIDCDVGRNCVVQQYVDHDPSSKAQDYRCGTLTYDGHNGTDFRLPNHAARRAGVSVLAAADGQVLRTRDGMPDNSVTSGGMSAVTDRECGNGVVISHEGEWETQYCHLAQGSVLVRPGDRVTAGRPIGRVGLSGKTQFPHLHFTLRHQGHVVDPFALGMAEGTCGGGTSLWTAAVRTLLTYQARAVLNTGFADGPVTMEQVEAGELERTAPGSRAAALVAFVRAIGLKAGDVQRLSLVGPDKQIIADNSERPLDRDKAQVLLFTGKKRPPGGWPAGRYQATYSISRNGQIELERLFVNSF
jgi:murein DD-endopeptidase MepM/ murein hydrolase activator NlpD